ncbi:MAG: iron ABC transporter permease [Bacteroidales bacterium]|jgi:iron complex transport system permease protein|nr:iron ABC transporter permease [Bacteroidales bacterium]
MNKKTIILFFLIIIISIILFVLDFNTGNSEISFKEIFQFFNIFDTLEGNHYLLIKEFRFPRIFAAILSGAALSVSGLLMQTIFRNPLADPSILGISSGASLGVAIVVLGTSAFFENSINSNTVLLISGAIGAGLVLFLILAVSARIKDMLSILIIGILISGVISAVVSILQYFANDISLKSYIIWTMGSLVSVSFKDICLLFPIISILIIIIFSISKSLNLILPGENFATTMGVNVQIIKISIFSVVSILTGAITVYCGPIAFIGIVAPHIARWIFNSSNHFILIPSSIIIGICFMLCGDILTHIISANGIMPINAITSILGTPFIIWIVIKNKRTIV